jgi:hypothetical protein
MPATLTIHEDADAESCNWQHITKIIQKWSTSHTRKKIYLPATTKNSIEISLDVSDDKISSAIQELHRQLYDQHVNFYLR